MLMNKKKSDLMLTLLLFFLWGRYISFFLANLTIIEDSLVSNSQFLCLQPFQNQILNVMLSWRIYTKLFNLVFLTR